MSRIDFNVGDKVRVIDAGKTYSCFEEMHERLSRNIAVKPFIKNKLPNYNEEGVIKAISRCDTHILIETCSGSYVIGRSGIEFIEHQTEFTFKELIARNVPGVYVKTVNNSLRIEQVRIRQDGYIEIKADYWGIDFIGGVLGITDDVKFKLEEPKQEYRLIEVVHAVNGKTYTFRERVLNPFDDYLKPHEFVICDTTMGNTFGRVAGTVERELTEKEYLEYKECWRAE